MQDNMISMIGITPGVAKTLDPVLAEDPAASPMIYWFGQVCLEKFAVLTDGQAWEAAETACQIVTIYPLKRGEGGVFPIFSIPHFGECSLPFCYALALAFQSLTATEPP